MYGFSQSVHVNGKKLKTMMMHAAVRVVSDFQLSLSTLDGKRSTSDGSSSSGKLSKAFVIMLECFAARTSVSVCQTVLVVMLSYWLKPWLTSSGHLFIVGA